MIDQQTSEEIVSLYKGWHEIEKSNKIDIIDFDLVPEIKGIKVKSREEVLRRLKYLHSSFEPETKQEVFIKAKLDASIYLLRALMDEEIPYTLYVEKITGVTPEIIDEKIIERQYERTYELMLKAGYKPSRQTLKEFIETLKMSKEEATRREKICELEIVPIFKKGLGFENVKPVFTTDYVEEDDYWKGWSSTKSDGTFWLRFNFHPMVDWYKGEMQILPTHEIAHFVHGANLKQGIQEGRINPAIGVTTVYEPHTFAGEGTANGVLDIAEVEKEFSKFGLLAREQRVTTSYLLNNAHIRVNEGEDIDKLVEYILERSPFANAKRYRRILELCRDNPTRRGYVYVYGYTRKKHREFQQMLTPGQFLVYLNHAMSTYETPKQLMAFVNQLARR